MTEMLAFLSEASLNKNDDDLTIVIPQKGRQLLY